MYVANKMYEMFQENTDSNGAQKMKVDFKFHENGINEIKGALLKIK